MTPVSTAGKVTSISSLLTRRARPMSSRPSTTAYSNGFGTRSNERRARYAAKDKTACGAGSGGGFCLGSDADWQRVTAGEDMPPVGCSHQRPTWMAQYEGTVRSRPPSRRASPSSRTIAPSESLYPTRLPPTPPLVTKSAGNDAYSSATPTRNVAENPRHPGVPRWPVPDVRSHGRGSLQGALPASRTRIRGRQGLIAS